MRKVWRFFLGFLSILALLFGVTGMLTTSIYGGATSIVGAALLWPSIGDWVNDHLKKKWTAFAFGLFFWLFAGPIVMVATAPTQAEISQRQGQDKEKEVARLASASEARLRVEEQKAESRAEAFRKHEEERQRGLLAYREQLEREVKSIQSIKASSYIKDVASINRGLVLIGAWALLYEQGGALSLDDQTRKVRQEFLRTVSKKQVEMLPVMRDAYGPAMRQQLWEADGSAKTFGAGFKTVEFIASEFVRNANIKRMNDQMHEVLMMLRFNQVRYKWFDGASEYTYYELTPPSDAEVVKWNDGGSFEVLR